MYTPDYLRCSLIIVVKGTPYFKASRHLTLSPYIKDTKWKSTVDLTKIVYSNNVNVNLE